MNIRLCKHCEWYHEDSDDVGWCYHEVNTIETEAEGFCSHWEPRWKDNPQVQKRWEKFQTWLTLSMSHD